MPIYEAEFLGDPTPIKPTSVKQSRKPKVKKPSVEEPPMVDPTPAHIPQPDKVDTKGPVKKKRKVVVVTEPEPSPEEEPPKKKRKQTVKPKLPTPPPSDISQEEEVIVPEKPVKAKKQRAKALPKIPDVIIDGKGVDEPPSWFKKHLLEEAKRRNDEKEKKERVPATEVKKVATESAHKKWNDGFTRDKINNEVTTHMNRLYQQIHGRR
jgi:hypothetical protein